MMGYNKGLGGGPKGGQFYKNNFAMAEEYGDEDMDDYGMYYAEDDSEDQEPQFAQNYAPSAMFQGGAKGGPMGMGGVSAASGVPFYGQQQKPMGAGRFTYGSMGGGAGTFMSGGAPAQSTGGGFTYGMASKGGNLFGPPAQPASKAASSNPLAGGTQFGAASASGQNPGLFQFGKVSSFGGLGGSTFGAGTAGGLFGATSAPVDDPYANIAIDLNKVKKSEPPPKLHELKTEEEKKKEAEAKKAAANATNAGKSLLKKDFEEKKKDDEDTTKGRKRSVTFGKSTTYEVERGETEESTEFINKDNVGEKGSPRPSEKKVIAEKDLSDGRSEKEKILEMLEKQQREQLEEIRQLNEISGKNKGEDSIGESNSSVPTNAQAKAKAENSNSYDTDDFEDISASGSGSKQKLTYWPGKDAFQKQNDKEQPKKTNDTYDPKAMEEYMKKQQSNKSQPVSKPQTTASKANDYSESSNTYEEDFESMSKSQTALTNSMLASPKNNATKATTQQKPAFEYKPQEFKSVAELYKKKENQFVQTEATKYDFMGPSDQTSGSYKEWTLQQNLKDAESLIQELKSQVAETKEKNKDLELQLKKKDMDYQTARRESLNANENAKRLQEQLKDAVHKNNLYKIETEELIKQIDLADAKTRNKEDELKLVQSEYERKLKLQEERILFRVSKQEERETLEMKRQHMLEKEELQNKVQELQEEISYFNEKVAKIEADNKALKLGKDSTRRIKELEDEVDYLKHQLSMNIRTEQENINLKNIKNDLSREDQIKLQRELQQLELMVKGYQEENEKALIKQKQLEKDLKACQDKAMSEAKKVRDLQQKMLINNEQVYVEEAKNEPDIQTVNNMGVGGAISQKTLQDMHAQIQKLLNEKQDYERDVSVKEGQYKSQIAKLRDEKTAAEKQLVDMEFLVGDKDKEIQKLRDEFRVSKEQLTTQIAELEEKVSWFRQNQRLISEEDSEKDNMQKELASLREKVKTLELEAKRSRDLEKKCKLLEETIKSKNPNSIPMMLQAVKDTTVQDKQAQSEDKKKIQQLEAELDAKDKEFEKKLRTLRQEQERMKQLYEKKQGQTPEAKRITELEDELEKTKQYYNKRIREIEDKYKFRIPEKDGAKKPPQAAKNLKDEKTVGSKQPVIDISEQKNYDDIIEKLTKERNLLAQKVVNLETQNNKRRQQFSGPAQQSLTNDEAKVPFAAIYYISKILLGYVKNDNKDNQINLIEAALTCVEQLKTKDPVKNNQISQLLLKLTQELNSQQTLNDKALNDIITICAKEIQLDDLALKPQHSMPNNMNKDLSGVMNSFTESKISPQKPPKTVSHPFVVEQTKPKRQAKDILKLIVQSGIDFERVVKERKLNPTELQVNQLYQIMREEEQSLKQITLDEVKEVIRFVKDKSGFDSEEIGKEDQIELQDLLNVIMDVSLDIFGVIKSTDSILGAPGRYSQELNKSPQQDEVKRLKEQIRQLQQDKEGKYVGVQSKVERLQQAFNELKSEKQMLLDKIEKLESSKTRLERIMKQTMGGRSSLKKTNGAEVDNNDIFDELSLLLKRIEFLEQQSEEREKMTYMEHGPCKRELQRLEQELQEERIEKQRLLAKKNSEVAYFKSELDALLSEMRNTMTNKKQQISVKF